MFQYKSIDISTINIVLSRKLPADISDAITSKLEGYICKWNRDVSLDVYLSSSKVEFDKINVMFQTRKCFGNRTSSIELNCSININTMVTFFIDESRGSIDINILIE